VDRRRREAAGGGRGLVAVAAGRNWAGSLLGRLRRQTTHVASASLAASRRAVVAGLGQRGNKYNGVTVTV